MNAYSDVAFFRACREAGIKVGIEAGLLTLAMRHIFESGASHGMLRHMNGMWEMANEHEEGARIAMSLGASMNDPDVKEWLAEAKLLRMRINNLRGEYLK